MGDLCIQKRDGFDKNEPHIGLCPMRNTGLFPGDTATLQRISLHPVS